MKNIVYSSILLEVGGILMSVASAFLIAGVSIVKIYVVNKNDFTCYF